jgi:hypothetical protein
VSNRKFLYFSIIRKSGSGDLPAKSPGLVTGSIAKQKNFSLPRPHFKIIMTGRSGILLLLIPAIHDFKDFAPLPQMRESPGSLFSLVSGVTFHLNFLKNPFSFHFFFSLERTQRGIAAIKTYRPPSPSSSPPKGGEGGVRGTFLK